MKIINDIYSGLQKKPQWVINDITSRSIILKYTVVSQFCMNSIKIPITIVYKNGAKSLMIVLPLLTLILLWKYK